MKTIMSFLTRLVENNNKPWFDAHKSEYQEVKAKFEIFASQLIVRLGEFDPSVRGLQLKDCTYRIYRDVRFSQDKSPYKTHMGVFVAPMGKCSGHAGYYFHVEPPSANYIGRSMMSAGTYRPDPKSQKSIREEIMLNGDQFDKSVKTANGFTLDFSDSLKKMPKGFEECDQYAKYLKLKDYFLYQNMNEGFLYDDNLLDNVLTEFRKTQAFNFILNRAIDYANER